MNSKIINIANNLGLCFGVKRALDLAMGSKAKTYTLGWLIHNRHVVGRLDQQGIGVIENLDDLPANSTLVISAHGVTRELFAEIRKRKIRVLDTTCPFVKKIHDIAGECSMQGYQTVIFGDRDHKEVHGIASYAKNPIIIENIRDARALGTYGRIVFVAQTTQSVEDYKTILEEVARHAEEVRVCSTICNATTERQNAAKKIAGESEIMLVIGDRKSANTKRLAHLCSRITETHQIEDASEIDKSWLSKKIGVTAGASTPDWIIKAVLDTLKNSNMSFEDTLSSYRNKLNRDLAGLFDGSAGFIGANLEKAGAYLVSGGKRLRPIALIMAYRAVGGKNSIITPSLSVELFHASTLVHDDLMDEDDLRRGNPSLHRSMEKMARIEKMGKAAGNAGRVFKNRKTRFGASASICDGNILLAMGAKCLCSAPCGDRHIIEALSAYMDAYRAVNEGQLLDIYMENRECSEDQYLDMISRKTSALFSASLRIGAILGGGDEKQVRSLAGFGMLAGLAFQLQDDIMDISAHMGKGHQIGSDLRAGKRTLLVIKAMELGTDKEKAVLKATLGNQSASHEVIGCAIDALYSTGAVQYVTELARNSIMKAKKDIGDLDITGEGKQFFMDFADFMLNRKQ
ncbi:MAG: 4-hydroxy-3-methylbut-2-enyl diphosphate reductase [archaeon]